MDCNWYVISRGVIWSPVVISIKTTSRKVSNVAFSLREKPPYSSSCRIGSKLSISNWKPSEGRLIISLRLIEYFLR